MKIPRGWLALVAATACSSSSTPPTGSGSAALTPPSVPGAIQAPADEHVAGRFHLAVAETFACKPQAAGDAGGTAVYAWTTVTMDAKIEDWDTNAVIGMHTHSPAPTFTSNDGSSVVAMPAANVPSPTGAGGPWLLLTAVSHSGTGMFSSVTSLQRIDTSGLPPSTGCDATTDPTLQQTVNESADFYYYAK